MLTRLAHVALDRPRRVLLAAFVFLVVAGVLGGPVAGLLSTGDDFADPGAESVAAQERLQDATGAQTTPGIVVLVRPGTEVRSAAGLRAVERVADRVAADPDIARTVAFTARRDPALVSRDGSATYVLGFQAPDAGDDGVAERLTEAFAGDATVVVGGGAATGSAVSEQVSTDLARAELLAFPLLFLLSLMIFRGVIAALLPLFVGVLTIMGTFLGLRIVNELTLLSIFALNLAIALGLALAIDYSLFVVSRYREELDRGLGTREALTRTMLTAGRTVLFSSLTVAAAMLALLVFPQRFLYSMGLAGALVAVLAAVVSLTALPALLAVLGPRVNALAPSRLRHREIPVTEGRWYRLTHAIMRRPGTVAIVTAGALVAVGLPFTGVTFVGVDAGVLPRDAAPRIVHDALRAEFAGSQTAPLNIALTAPEDAADEVGAYARRLGTLEGAAAVAPPRFTRGDTWFLQVTPEAAGLDERSLELVADVRAADAPGPVQVAGESARFVDQQDALGARLPVALAILATTTLILLFLLTGSVVLPFKALLMNALTICAAFGLLVLIFQDGRFEDALAYVSQGGLEATQPLVLLAIAFGLSTDYGVFVLTRIKEARDQGLSNDEAVAVGLQRTGRIVTAAAALLAVAIGAFATSEIIFIKQVGLGTAAAVIIDATIVRALLVPSLMKLLGERNWWAPAPLRRLHERLGPPHRRVSGEQRISARSRHSTASAPADARR